MSSSKKTSILILVAALVVVGILLIYVPIVPVSYQEPYNAQVPYMTMENKQATIGSTTDKTLEGGYYISWSYSIPVGRDIEFSVSASDTVYLYIFTLSQYNNYKDTGQTTPNEKESQEISNGKIGYHVSSADTYYFVIHNPHDGFLGLGKKNVGIYSASIKSYWQEQVTAYRTETHYRTIEKTVTLWESITGSYATN